MGQAEGTRNQEAISNNKVVYILKISDDKCKVKVNLRVFLGYVYKLPADILMFQDIEITAYLWKDLLVKNENYKRISAQDNAEKMGIFV